MIFGVFYIGFYKIFYKISRLRNILGTDIHYLLLIRDITRYGLRIGWVYDRCLLF